LSEMNCALGLAQLQRIDAILDARAAVASGYHQRLQNLPLTLPPLDLPHARISWFVYVVRLAHQYSHVQRDALLHALSAHGIGCARYFAPIHLQPAYSEWSSLDLPVTQSASARTIALPFFNRLTAEQQDYVCYTLSREISAL
jgi:dTDP-4-amino-4,6-dideoxygalactose transaminase